jgi:hypothetical protein
VPARIEQPPVVVLPVQFDQRVGQRPEHLARRAAVVDEGRLAPVPRVDPPQDQLVRARKPRLLQHRPAGMILAEVELCRHFPLLGARANQIRPPAPAEHEAERVEQDRLSRPGLSRQHVQPRPEVE